MKYKNIPYIMIFVLLASLIAIPAIAEEEDEDIRRITKEEAKTLIDKEGVTIVDVRYTKNWKKSEQKIAGAVREDPNELGSWTEKYSKDHMIILYCD
jgi:rhodanese-related sulfurtransferase